MGKSISGRYLENRRSSEASLHPSRVVETLYQRTTQPMLDRLSEFRSVLGAMRLGEALAKGRDLD